MGLRGAIKAAKRRVIEEAAAWYVRDWTEQAREGKKGEMPKKAWEWVLGHKSQIGVVFTFFWAGLAGVSDGCPRCEDVLEVLEKIAPFLLGAGFIKSDSYYKERKAK